MRGFHLKKLKLSWFCLLWLFLFFVGCWSTSHIIVQAVEAADEDTTESSESDQVDQTCSADDRSCHAENTDDNNNEEGGEDDGPGRPNPDCKDDNENCEDWASQGECDANPGYMLDKCRLSCMICSNRVFSQEELHAGADLGVPQVMQSDSVNEDQAAAHIAKSRNLLKASKEVELDVKKLCKNRDKMCTIRAVSGECETNFDKMKTLCPASCQSCFYLTREGRCPIDPNEPNAWPPGGLDKMFTRLTNQPYLSDYDVKILSSPSTVSANGTTGGPWVITMENVLSAVEAETLIQLGAEQGYVRSTGTGKLKANGDHERHTFDGRTSSNTWCVDDCFNHEITQRVVSRLSNITGIPPNNSEYLQMLQYEVGQKYVSHHDYIPFHIKRQPGVRILTMYLYLSDVEAGGGTNFDALDLTVMPKRGRAVLWPSVFDDKPNEKDERTTHQALPVEAGVKYGANAWFHQRDFKNPFHNACE